MYVCGWRVKKPPKGADSIENLKESVFDLEKYEGVSLLGTLSRA